MTEHFTFPATDNGLELALETTLTLRRNGFKTRLATRRFTGGTDVFTVVAVRPPTANRKERGCEL
jgi:hypothetical protein